MTSSDAKIATFDCYGTLVDWEGGAASFLYALALRHEPAPADNGDALRRRWEAIQIDLIRGPYRPYKEILTESLRRWLDERGYPGPPDLGAAFARAMRSWQPFPDTIPALRHAKAAGWRLAILSNTDDDLIAHTLRHLEIPFDAVVTAEQVGSYKPSAANFQHLLETIAEPPARVLHVGAGYAYDMEPAAALGMGTAWVNRRAEPVPGSVQPDRIWRDLWGLAALAGGPGPGL